MKKKIIISTLIIGFLLTTSIATVSAYDKLVSFKGLKSIESSDVDADIYVDDDAPSEWYNETNKKTIQEGVSNASSGNTVFVYSGYYSGGVLIDKTLRLVGENKNTTFISGNEDCVIYVDADEVEISGFAIGNNEDGYGVDVNGNNCSVTGNIIVSNTVGVVALFHSGLVVSGNIIHSNEIGVGGMACEYTTIAYNTVYNNFQGVVLQGLFIESYECKNNMIIYNKITNNQRGIDLQWCEETVIFCNVLENNGLTGVHAKNTSGTKICLNGIKNNGLEPDPLEEELLPAGVILDETNAIVCLNNIKGNKDFGLKAVNSSVNAKLNYWGAILGPKFGFFGDRVSSENSVVKTFPWIPVNIGLAGDIGDWEPIE